MPAHLDEAVLRDPSAAGDVLHERQDVVRALGSAERHEQDGVVRPRVQDVWSGHVPQCGPGFGQASSISRSAAAVSRAQADRPGSGAVDTPSRGRNRESPFVRYRPATSLAVCRSCVVQPQLGRHQLGDGPERTRRVDSSSCDRSKAIVCPSGSCSSSGGLASAASVRSAKLAVSESTADCRRRRSAWISALAPHRARFAASTDVIVADSVLVGPGRYRTTRSTDLECDALGTGHGPRPPQRRGQASPARIGPHESGKPLREQHRPNFTGNVQLHRQ